MLEIIVFVCGAVGMILELVGVRLLAPHFGTSLVVWTSIIGVFLGSLSIGYNLGGRLSQSKNKQVISLILLSISLFILTESFFKEVTFAYLSKIRDLRLSSLFGAIYLFSGPAVFMGAILPVAMRLKIANVKDSGRVAGRLYALSTIGSIVGTFLGGFYLIPTFGTNNIFKFIALVTGVLALLIASGVTRKRLFLLLIPFSMLLFIEEVLPNSAVVADVDSLYSRLVIKRYRESETHREIIFLTNARSGAQSMMYVDSSDELAAPYTRFFRLGDAFNPNITTALMLGGGAYSYPKDFLKNHPTGKLDVVEIDSKMTDIAKKYFNFSEDERLTLHHIDARVYLNTNIASKKYDAVYVDVFGSDVAPPFSITTKEALQNMSAILGNDGVVVVNVVSALRGRNSDMLKAQIRTYKAVFPVVYLFKVDERLPDYAIQNIMLVALRSNDNRPLPEFLGEFKNLRPLEESGLLSEGVAILTDDFAPVEYYARLF